MPDEGNGAPAGRRDRATTAVGAWLAGLPGVRLLRPNELQVYASRGVMVGWRLAVGFDDRQRDMDLLLPAGFPRRPPRVSLVDRPKFLTWPHVEEDGVLCLLGDNAEVDFARPAAVTKNLLASGVELVQNLVATGRPDDFRAEFETYWHRSVGRRATPVYSLLDPIPPSRITRVWRGQRFYLVGEEEAVVGWLRNRFPDGVKTETEAAAIVWLPHPLLPSEFPDAPSQVIKLAHDCGGGHVLEQLVADGQGQVVILAAPTTNGPCFAAVTLIPKSTYGQLPLDPDGPLPGFRPGKAPRRLRAKLLYGGGTARKSVVERADAAWVHGRGQDPRFARLRAATVVVIGCGSIGAPVALQLAGAGVGKLILIDPELLKWANVGRHPLGAPGVGKAKADGLADLIRSSYPHMRAVEPVVERWEDASDTLLKELASCDLVVSAIGNWAAEGALNEWCLANRRVPVVYGWTEAHACAGHAVAICPSGGCLQCGFSTDGTPLLRVTNWPGGATVRQEPACGATYQPYGPVELGHIISLVSELTLDCVLGAVGKSTHRVWAGRPSLLQNAGGEWSSDWVALVGGRTQGGFVEEREWPRSPSCAECGASPP